MARQTRPTKGRRAQASAQGMADARALEAIVARAKGGTPLESDRPMLIAIASRLPAPVRAEIAKELKGVFSWA